MSALSLVLTFERGRWRARGSGVDVVHPELRGLEDEIEERLGREAPVDVHFEFDMAALPRWLHQYQTHYLNYTLRVPRRGARA
jgi:hypothetical protein